MRKFHLPRSSKNKKTTHFINGQSDVLDLPASSARKRRQETMENAMKTDSNPQLSPQKKKRAALRGLFNTVVTNGTQKNWSTCPKIPQQCIRMSYHMLLISQ